MSPSAQNERLSYNAEQYAERNDIDLDADFWDNVRALQQGKEVNQRVLIIRGEAGIGKTWLLKHLEQQVKEQADPSLTSYYLDLSTLGSDSQPLPTTARILQEFAQKVLSFSDLSGIQPSELSLKVMQRTREYLIDHLLILLVDSAYETDWAILRELEEYFLGPLAVEKKVLIILAGRGPAFSWSSPELGFRARQIPLKPFAEEETQEQIDKLSLDKPPSAGDIHKFSQGIPLITYLFTTDWPSTPATDVQAYNQIIDNFLAIGIPHPKQTTVKDKVDERTGIRQYLEVLSVLRIFKNDHIPLMLTVYDGTTATKIGESDILSSLLERGYAHWDQKTRAYKINEPIRKFIEEFLILQDTEKWQKLCCSAYRLYEEWANKYERTKNKWENEMHYHQECLQAKGFDVENCPPLATRSR